MGETDLRGKLGPVLMGGAILSKSLIQFSVDGWSWVPSMLFTWGQTMVKVMEIMVTSFKRSHACTATLCLQPCSRLPPTHASAGDSWTLPGKSGWVSWGGHCSFLLGAGAQGPVCALQESISQSCVNSGSSMVGLMVTSSKRAYAIPKSDAPRAPQETLKHSSISVSVGSLGPGVDKICLTLLASLAGLGFDSKHKFAPPTVKSNIA